MNSELRSYTCKSCNSEKTQKITLPSGHQARECLLCGLVWSTDARSSGQLYDSAYDGGSGGFTWDTFLKSHETLKGGGEVELNWYEKMFLSRIRPRKQSQILEVGCSVGRFLLGCKNRGWQVKGLDISKKAVLLAKQLLPNADIQSGRLEEVPWPENSLDAIAMWEVIEHVSDPYETVYAAKKLLKDRGLLGISTPDWDCRVIRCHPAPNYWPPYHICFFNKRSLLSLLQRASMKVILVRRNPIPWSETRWPKWKRIIALPWLIWLGIILRQGGGRLVVLAKKV